MTKFRGVEHDIKVVSLSVPKVLAKNAILAAYWAQLGHFGTYLFKFDEKVDSKNKPCQSNNYLN